jgi:hypothetical protein
MFAREIVLVKMDGVAHVFGIGIRYRDERKYAHSALLLKMCSQVVACP